MLLILGTVLVILKLAGVIAWSWLAVCIPFIVIVAVFLFVPVVSVLTVIASVAVAVWSGIHDRPTKRR